MLTRLGLRLALVALLVSAVQVLVVQTPAAAVDKDCGDFDTQAQAQNFFLNNDPQNDPHNLDADGDGVACESLPCPCNESTGGGGGGGGASTIRQWARVIRVIDGDTVKVRLASGRRKSVRMIGINTPESGRCGYGKATRSLKRLTPAGTRVKLVSDPTQRRTDRYGRLLRYVMKGKRDVNRAQIVKGVAKVYVYNNRPFKRVQPYRKSMRAAKANRRGLWRSCWS